MFFIKDLIQSTVAWRSLQSLDAGCNWKAEADKLLLTDRVVIAGWILEQDLWGTGSGVLPIIHILLLPGVAFSLCDTQNILLEVTQPQQF
jgi:hypothetical protein